MLVLTVSIALLEAHPPKPSVGREKEQHSSKVWGSFSKQTPELDEHPSKRVDTQEQHHISKISKHDKPTLAPGETLRPHKE